MEEGRLYEEGATGLEFNAKAYVRFYKAIINGERLRRCIPDFVINESLKYFERNEQYEKCSMIQSFFEKNPARVFHMSRTDWMNFGWRTVYAH